MSAPDPLVAAAEQLAVACDTAAHEVEAGDQPLNALTSATLAMAAVQFAIADELRQLRQSLNADELGALVSQTIANARWSG